MTITEQPGQLQVVQDEQLLASLHYLCLSDTSWVLEQIFVRPSQSATTLANQLIKRFTELATAAQVTVTLLDPYAKRYFSQHPADQAILAANQLHVTGDAAVKPVALHLEHTEEE
ncbi:N-acetyltransferase [Levilactobacillus yiduensis]|uniref:N-acetyltransferase n=1 Tax=Levilactobacillus yiduensis TaxID=2953880 RepID=UPI000EF2CC6A|nr:N-acetyltransferase [Levilactobacillus yiduensis]AYM03841.1 acetyltransferase [Levilactobacillus brevis]